MFSVTKDQDGASRPQQKTATLNGDSNHSASLYVNSRALETAEQNAAKLDGLNAPQSAVAPNEDTIENMVPSRGSNSIGIMD